MKRKKEKAKEATSLRIVQHVSYIALPLHVLWLYCLQLCICWLQLCQLNFKWIDTLLVWSLDARTALIKYLHTSSQCEYFVWTELAIRRKYIHFYIKPWSPSTSDNSIRHPLLSNVQMQYTIPLSIWWMLLQSGGDSDILTVGCLSYPIFEIIYSFWGLCQYYRGSTYSSNKIRKTNRIQNCCWWKQTRKTSLEIHRI